MFRKWLSLTTVSFASVITVTSANIAAQTDGNKRNRLCYSNVIIGAGWAGLGVAASLTTNGVDDFLILEKGGCVGYFWSKLYDNLRMNTYRHRLWRSPLTIEPKQIEDYRTKNGVLDYLIGYSKYHNINEHIQFNKEVRHIDYDEANHEWILNLNNGQQIHTALLTIATSINRVPFIPELKNMDKFKGCMLHTFEYRNPEQFDNLKVTNKKRRFLVVGCGNSAIEIAGQIKKYDKQTNDVTLLVRNGRHFTKEKTKHRFESVLDRICSPSPFSEQSLMKDNMVSCNDLSFHTDIILFDKLTDFLIFTDLQSYGIPKPKLSPTADHYYNKKLTIVDRGTIPLIKKRQINVCNKSIKGFTPNGVEFTDGTHESYDVIIFGTGYRHGLNELFDEDLWNILSTDTYNYPNGLMSFCSDKNIELPMNRGYRWPFLNGRGRSKIYDNLYFAGFDQGYLGGLTIGLYSWSIGEEIAVKLGKISINQCTMPWIKTETMIDEIKTISSLNCSTDTNRAVDKLNSQKQFDSA